MHEHVTRVWRHDELLCPSFALIGGDAVVVVSVVGRAWMQGVNVGEQYVSIFEAQ